MIQILTYFQWLEQLKAQPITVKGDVVTHPAFSWPGIPFPGLVNGQHYAVKVDVGTILGEDGQEAGEIPAMIFFLDEEGNRSISFDLIHPDDCQ